MNAELVHVECRIAEWTLVFDGRARSGPRVSAVPVSGFDRQINGAGDTLADMVAAQIVSDGGALERIAIALEVLAGLAIADASPDPALANKLRSLTATMYSESIDRRVAAMTDA